MSEKDRFSETPTEKFLVTKRSSPGANVTPRLEPLLALNVVEPTPTDDAPVTTHCPGAPKGRAGGSGAGGGGGGGSCADGGRPKDSS